MTGDLLSVILSPEVSSKLLACVQVSTISFEKATSVHRLKRLPDWFRNLRSLSNVCGNKRGCQCVSLFAVPPPHHNKSCYLSSWYKLPRPIQACHKRAWEVHQPKEGNSTNAEVTCHFLYSSNYDTSLSYLLSSAYQSPFWKYRKIPKISPQGLYFSKALFKGLIFGGAYFRNFCGTIFT